MAAAASLLGCTFTFGIPPRTDHLTQLTPGQSTSSDVLLSLGEPSGKGAAHLSPDIPLRSIWYYEYSKAKVHGAAQATMLLVFMQGDRYDGYLWFSGSLTVKQAGK